MQLRAICLCAIHNPAVIAIMAKLGAYAVHTSLQTALNTASFCGRITSRLEIDGDVSALSQAMPHPSAALTFSLNLDEDEFDRAELPFMGAMTTLFRDVHSQYRNAPVFKDVVAAVFMHKDGNNTWRVGTALGGGNTILSSQVIGGLEPPIAGWCDGSGNIVDELYCLDSLLWASLCLHKRVHPANVADVPPVPPAVIKQWSPKPSQIYDPPPSVPVKPSPKHGRLSVYAAPKSPIPFGPKPPLLRPPARLLEKAHDEVEHSASPHPS
jgi:hypothetical protein